MTNSRLYQTQPGDDLLQSVLDAVHRSLIEKRHDIEAVVGRHASGKEGTLASDRSDWHSDIEGTLSDMLGLKVEEDVPVFVSDGIGSKTCQEAPAGTWESMVECCAKRLLADDVCTEPIEEFAGKILACLRRKMVELLGERELLGVYYPKGDATTNGPCIRIFWIPIILVAEELRVAVEDLTAVVLAHEWGHAFTHLGVGQNGQALADRFSDSSRNLKEGVAQYMAQQVSYGLRGSRAGMVRAFENLAAEQPSVYKHGHPTIARAVSDSQDVGLVLTSKVFKRAEPWRWEGKSPCICSGTATPLTLDRIEELLDGVKAEVKSLSSLCSLPQHEVILAINRCPWLASLYPHREKLIGGIVSDERGLVSAMIASETKLATYASGSRGQGDVYIAAANALRLCTRFSTQPVRGVPGVWQVLMVLSGEDSGASPEWLLPLGDLTPDMQEYIILKRPDLMCQIKNLDPELRSRYSHECNIGGIEI